MTGSFFLIFFFDLDLNSFVGYCGILWDPLNPSGTLFPLYGLWWKKNKIRRVIHGNVDGCSIFFFFVLFYFFWKLYLILFDFVYVFVYGTFAIPFRYPWEMLQNNNR